MNIALPRISLLLPTRARPKLVERLFQSLVNQTGNTDSIEVILYIDEDDTASHSIHHEKLKLIKIIGPRSTMGVYNTACLKLARGEVIILMNDDMIVRTKGWDQCILKIHDQVKDGIYLAYPNELYMKEKLSIIPILSRKCCDLLITPYPEQYPGGFIDYHLFDIFMRLKKNGYDRFLYQNTIVFEHLHHRTGKSEFDETYQKRSRFDLGDETFINLRQLRQASADRLTAAINGERLHDLPEVRALEHLPIGSMSACVMFAKSFLLDKGLPVKWRINLFAVFVKRYLVRKFQNNPSPH